MLQGDRRALRLIRVALPVISLRYTEYRWRRFHVRSSFASGTFCFVSRRSNGDEADTAAL